jgi:hypothetical protein
MRPRRRRRARTKPSPQSVIATACICPSSQPSFRLRCHASTRTKQIILVRHRSQWASAHHTIPSCRSLPGIKYCHLRLWFYSGPSLVYIRTFYFYQLVPSTLTVNGIPIKPLVLIFSSRDQLPQTLLLFVVCRVRATVAFEIDWVHARVLGLPQYWFWSGRAPI